MRHEVIGITPSMSWYSILAAQGRNVFTNCLNVSALLHGCGGFFFDTELTCSKQGIAQQISSQLAPKCVETPAVAKQAN